MARGGNGCLQTQKRVWRTTERLCFDTPSCFYTFCRRGLEGEDGADVVSIVTIIHTPGQESDLSVLLPFKSPRFACTILGRSPPHTLFETASSGFQLCFDCLISISFFRLTSGLTNDIVRFGSQNSLATQCVKKFHKFSRRRQVPAGSIGRGAGRVIFIRQSDSLRFSAVFGR